MKGWRKNMVLLIDTNVLLDISLKREPFLQDSVNALECAIDNRDLLYFSASSVTDFYYIMRNHQHDRDSTIRFLIDITDNIKYAVVDQDCIFCAFASNINDLEDAVIDEVASSVKADYILTRNEKDFVNSKVKAITPKQYLELFAK